MKDTQPHAVGAKIQISQFIFDIIHFKGDK